MTINSLYTLSIMSGDLRVDIETAKVNSMRSVGVLYRHGSKQEMEDARPEWIAIDPK